MFGTFSKISHNLSNSESLIRTQNFFKSNNSKILWLQKLPGLCIITLMVYWRKYIYPVKSFSSRAHIRICQIPPRPLTLLDSFIIFIRRTAGICNLESVIFLYNIGMWKTSFLNIFGWTIKNFYRYQIKNNITILY